MHTIFKLQFTPQFLKGNLDRGWGYASSLQNTYVVGNTFKCTDMQICKDLDVYMKEKISKVWYNSRFLKKKKMARIWWVHEIADWLLLFVFPVLSSVNLIVWNQYCFGSVPVTSDQNLTLSSNCRTLVAKNSHSSLECSVSLSWGGIVSFRCGGFLFTTPFFDLTAFSPLKF